VSPRVRRLAALAAVLAPAQAVRWLSLLSVSAGDAAAASLAADLSGRTRGERLAALAAAFPVAASGEQLATSTPPGDPWARLLRDAAALRRRMPRS
jgi:hypothetical protein